MENEVTFFEDLLNMRPPVPLPPVFLKAYREAATEILPDLPAPTIKDEEWKFTNITPILRSSFTPFFETHDKTDRSEISRYDIPEADGVRVVFVNGFFSPELSQTDDLPGGVVLTTLAEAGEKEKELIRRELGNHTQTNKDPFLALNASFLHDGAYLRVPPEVKIERPVHLQFISTRSDQPFFAAPRCLIIGEAYSKFTVIEDYIGLGSSVYLNVPVVEIRLDEGAHLLHTRLQRESPGAFHIGNVGATLAAQSDYESYSVHTGSRISRNVVHSALAGPEINCTLDGLVLIGDDQLSDTHTLMDHQQPYCTSHQLHKTAIDGNARSVFNGKIFVRKGAQKTDSFQENRNLLLSEKGIAFTKPQLEIFADDVKCSHGATVGQFDDNELFYLQSRGLSKERSRQLLVYGFALDIIERIPVASVQKQLSEAVGRFSGRNEAIQDLV